MNKYQSLPMGANEFKEIIGDIIKNDTVKQMYNFRQHYDTSCYEHCFRVALYNYIICKKLKLDYISATRAGMLHDLFLYDWRVPSPDRKRLHAFHHPRIALENSSKLFNLNKKEQEIILKHMWPITLIPPRYLETYITTLVDKYCAIEESVIHYKNNKKLNLIYRYAYVFLSLLVIRIF